VDVKRESFYAWQAAAPARAAKADDDGAIDFDKVVTVLYEEITRS
jgi:hypothetical protein